MPATLKQWQIDAIKQMNREGKSQRMIADTVGINLKTVNSYCQRLNGPKGKTSPTPIVERFIDMSTVPTADTISTDIMIVYRATLAELHKRLHEMSTNEIYQLSMSLLREINDGDSEN